MKSSLDWIFRASLALRFLGHKLKERITEGVYWNFNDMVGGQLGRSQPGILKSLSLAMIADKISGLRIEEEQELFKI